MTQGCGPGSSASGPISAATPAEGSGWPPRGWDCRRCRYAPSLHGRPYRARPPWRDQRGPDTVAGAATLSAIRQCRLNSRLAASGAIAGIILVIGGAVRKALTGGGQLLVDLLVVAGVIGLLFLYGCLRQWNATVFVRSGKVGMTTGLGSVGRCRQLRLTFGGRQRSGPASNCRGGAGDLRSRQPARGQWLSPARISPQPDPLAHGLGVNSFQCPSETTSTVPSLTLMAV